MEKNIIIKDGNFKFNYRVAGMIIYKDKILLQSDIHKPYYSLPGGRVQYNETSMEALIREMKEELNITVCLKDLSLLCLAENFFSYNEQNVHELLFLYRIDNIELVDREEIRVLDKETASVRWYPISTLKEMDLRPSFVKDMMDTHTIIHKINR